MRVSQLFPLCRDCHTVAVGDSHGFEDADTVNVPLADAVAHDDAVPHGFGLDALDDRPLQPDVCADL